MTKKKQDVLVEEAPESLSPAGKRAKVFNWMSVLAEEAPDSADEPHDFGSQQELKSNNLVARLEQAIIDLIAMQHARATAEGGTATGWFNAMAHIRRAIECIEQQAKDDSEPGD